MNAENQLLIASAAKLASLGKEVEAARAELKRLVTKGVSYNSDEMLKAYQSFVELNEYWKEIERQHLELRDEIKGKYCRFQNRLTGARLFFVCHIPTLPMRHKLQQSFGNCHCICFYILASK